jgi:L-rhamnose mutarotase
MQVMEKYAFRMRLHPGKAAEYQARHDAIWPELVTLLKDAGVSDYSIHLDEENGLLFGVLWRSADIMETRADNEPVAVPLKTVFHLK